MVCHMHPGHQHGRDLFRLHLVGQRNRRRAHVARRAAQASAGRAESSSDVAIRERSAVRGLWSDPDFLEKTGTPEFNRQLQHTQFADFHGHGWVFRAVFKHDRKGNLLDADDKMVPFDDPEKFDKAVHLKDIHLEKGMHCIDCHFEQDSHGNGKLYGETRNAVEIDCVDCHGTIQQHATLITSGTAAPKGGTNLARSAHALAERRFYWKDGRLYQRSML